MRWNKLNSLSTPLKAAATHLGSDQDYLSRNPKPKPSAPEGHLLEQNISPIQQPSGTLRFGTEDAAASYNKYDRIWLTIPYGTNSTPNSEQLDLP